MKQTIHAHEQELKRIFSDDYLFNIPPYQRPYAWTTEQAVELLDDLDMALGEKTCEISEIPPYFLGSIVLIKDPTYPEVEVVDGQQRLATLTILLGVLRELSDEKGASALQRYVCAAGDKFAGTEDRFRLTLRSRDSDFFRRYIQEPGRFAELKGELGRLSDSQANMRNNALFLFEKLEQLGAERRDRLAMFLLQRCYLVVVSASDQESAYRIFSVMNDRGLDLSPTDILKADIIGGITDTDKEKYNDTWEELEEDLGRDQFVELFGHIRMIYQKAKPRRTLTQEFRDAVKPLENPVSFIERVLTPMSEAFEMIENAEYESATLSDEINSYLRFLNRLDNRDWVPPAIVFLSRHRKEPQELLRFIKDLECLAYTMFITRFNVNSRIDRYAKVINAIEISADLYAHKSPLQLDKLEKLLVQSTLNEAIYPMVRVRLPLLLRLDTMLSAGGVVHDVKIITVEHVLPQNPRKESEWIKLFPAEEVREQWVDKLGNLALLSRSKNSQARNYDFERKKKEYFSRKGVTTFALTTEIVNEPEWTPEVIERRQKKLVKLLSDEWRLQ